MCPTPRRPAGQDGILNQLASRARYSAVGGKLAPLPYSGTESEWVADVFGEKGIHAVRLTGADATKARLKAQIQDRRIVHLACHGLADQSYGNFFGRPGPRPRREPERPGRRRLPDPGRDLRVGPEAVRTGDPQRLRDELRPAAAGRRRVGLVARIRRWRARGGWSPATGWSTTRRRPAW